MDRIEVDRIEALEARIRQLEAVIASLADGPIGMPVAELHRRQPDSEAEPTTSRRRVLRLAGGAAVGALVGGAAASQAAADGGLLFFASPTVALDPTRTSFAGNGFDDESAFLFADSVYDGNFSFFPAVLAGWASNTRQPHGVYGYTTHDEGFGVVGFCDAGTGNSGAGVFAQSIDGVGARAQGGTLDLELSGSGRMGFATVGVSNPPDLVSTAGLVARDSDGNLWACVADGDPGTWRRLAGPTTAGSFHPVTPFRIYDSRAAAPSFGKITRPSNRTVSVADSRHLVTGAVVAADAVPHGATAISCNITVVNTVAQGFLTVNPGGTTAVSAASVNWSAAGQINNNGIVVAINEANRQITVVCGGAPGANCDFVVDVTGYFR